MQARHRHSLETLEASRECAIQGFVALDAGAVVVPGGRRYAVPHDLLPHLVLEEEPPAATVRREKLRREGLHVHSPRRPARRGRGNSMCSKWSTRGGSRC